jgi:hypothetical protein
MALGGLEPLEHLRERVAPRELEEAVCRQGVERDVDAPQPGLGELVDLTGQQVAVGGQREVADVLEARQHLDQAPQLAPHERLAAGQADVVHAHAAQQGHEPRDLLVGQQRVALQPRQPLGRHAVLAAEVAAVGDRDAHVPDGAPVTVDELVHERW